MEGKRMEGKSSVATFLFLVIVLSYLPVSVLSAAGSDAYAITNFVPQEDSVNPSVATVTPVADSYVSESQPDANFGQEQSLRVGSKEVCYLMFELPQLESNATIAERG